ncbi:MAG: hypothetical protein OEY85_13645, partial [Rhodospirillales bacterium]|nr:hypothetical protein [Rhodospirillales bacterium]
VGAPRIAGIKRLIIVIVIFKINRILKIHESSKVKRKGSEKSSRMLFGRSCNDKGLLSEQPVSWRKSKIETNQPGRPGNGRL